MWQMNAIYNNNLIDQIEGRNARWIYMFWVDDYQCDETQSWNEGLQAQDKLHFKLVNYWNVFDLPFWFCKISLILLMSCVVIHIVVWFKSLFFWNHAKNWHFQWQIKINFAEFYIIHLWRVMNCTRYPGEWIGRFFNDFM